MRLRVAVVPFFTTPFLFSMFGFAEVTPQTSDNPVSAKLAPETPTREAPTREAPDDGTAKLPLDPAAPTLDPPRQTQQANQLGTTTAGARAVGLPPPGTRGDFLDTRLTWTFGDDDFLHPTGQLIPLSPNFSIGERPQYRLFFDNLNSRFSGRENITHLVMYKKLPGFIENLTTEAALALRIDLAALSANTGNLNAAFYDVGSYIRLHYRTGGPDAKPTGFSAVFFPLDTDRFRLGYLYDISWGGTAASINQSIFPRIQGASPGLKVQYDRDGFYAFVGFKTATIIQPTSVLKPGTESEVETVRAGETNYGFLGGLGIDATSHLRFDLGAGYFQQGKFDLDDVRGRPVYTYGGSGRIVVHDKMPVPQSVDFLLYQNDRQKPFIMFAPEQYTAHGIAWSVSAEASLLQQHLRDYDRAGVTKDQPAYATALQGVVTSGYLRLSATGIYRNLNFVVRNVPGFIPFETLPHDAKSQSELFGSLYADYHIAALRLTPGVGGGIQLPATFQSQSFDFGLPTSRTIVVRTQGDESIMPERQGRRPIYQARIGARWNISDMLTAVIWVQYVRDNNGTLVERNQSDGTTSLRIFQQPNRLGTAIALQARF